MGCASGCSSGCSRPVNAVRKRLTAARRGKSSEVSQYDPDADGADQACECGRIFIPKDALYCCYCAKKREGGNSSPGGSSSSSNSPRSPTAQLKFATICPNSPTLPPPSRRSNLRSGTNTSNSTNTSSNYKTNGSNQDSESHASERGSNSGDDDSYSDETQAMARSVSPYVQSSSPRTTGSRGGTPARRPSLSASDPALPLFDATGAPVEDIVQALTQALKHSGSIVTQNLRMRALQVPETLVGAYNATAKVDMLMPQFDAKVDLDNLLEKLPLSSLRASLSLQRVTFMSTDWLGIRLVHTDHGHCTRFCLCATALQNIGKNTSRSVVVESSDQDNTLVFACSPMYVPSRRSEWKSSFIDHAEEIGELAQVILNEAGNSEKKVTADVKLWCQKSQRRAEEESQNAAKRAATEDDLSKVTLDGSLPTNPEPTKEVSRRFSMSGFVKTLEAAFADLGGDSKPKGSIAAAKGAAARSRRMSTPAALLVARERSGSKGSSSSPERKAPLVGQARQRRHSMGAAMGGSNEEECRSPRGRRPSGSSSRTRDRSTSNSRRNSNPEASSQSKNNSDPGIDKYCSVQEVLPDLDSPPIKMKRRPSFVAADIMPTLDEDQETLQTADTMPDLLVQQSKAAPQRRRHSAPDIPRLQQDSSRKMSGGHRDRPSGNGGGRNDSGSKSSPSISGSPLKVRSNE